MKDNLVLFGLPGSGKTTVGSRLAERLNRPFFDTDQLMEAASGLSPRQIYRMQGDHSFRLLETQILTVLRKLAGVVIAVGGGTKTEGMIGKRILLLAEGELLWNRRKGEPAYVDPTDPKGSFIRLCREREEQMRQIADHCIPIDALNPDQIVEQIAEKLRQA
ncbi:MAG: shikimate kinase [Verrucomicrobia bacterium]|nr:shikimate kinase [Verrucomicrobiota bacterium]